MRKSFCFGVWLQLVCCLFERLPVKNNKQNQCRHYIKMVLKGKKRKAENLTLVKTVGVPHQQKQPNNKLLHVFTV